MRNKIWVTSDLHLFHEKVIEFCKRPFNDLEEMHEAIVSNWNERVHAGDRVYVLGDVSFGTPEQTRWLLSRLQGNKFLVTGNHDHKNRLTPDSWAWIRDAYAIKYGGIYIWCSHYPHETWPRRQYGAWHFHGHSHGRRPHFRRMDVGMDCWGFAPVDIDGLYNYMEAQELGYVHHEDDYIWDGRAHIADWEKQHDTAR